MSRRRGLARRYAQALAELASEQERLGEVEQGLQRVFQALETLPDVRRIWWHVRWSPHEKVSRLKEALGEKPAVDPLVYRFLGVVAAKGRESLLADMVQEYVYVADRLRGTLGVEVQSSTDLDEAARTALATQLARRLGVRSVRLSVRINPDLVGGLVVRAGDLRLDGSLVTQLNRLHAALRSVPLSWSASGDGKAG